MEKNQKDLNDALEFFERGAAAMRAAIDGEATRKEHQEVQRALEWGREQLEKQRAEKRELETQIERYKNQLAQWEQEYQQYATFDARRIRIKELDAKIAEAETRLKAANKGWAELKQKVEGIGRSSAA
jgi:chromosome segregation ATPase